MAKKDDPEMRFWLKSYRNNGMMRSLMTTLSTCTASPNSGTTEAITLAM
jgi:hypothetical protein